MLCSIYAFISSGHIVSKGQAHRCAKGMLPRVELRETSRVLGPSEMRGQCSMRSDSPSSSPPAVPVSNFNRFLKMLLSPAGSGAGWGVNETWRRVWGEEQLLEP